VTRLFAIFAIASITAGAAEPVWPPATDAASRLEDLRAVLMSATSTPAERQAAREEMMKMIVNDAAPRRPAQMPPRAAVDSPRSVFEGKPDLAKPLPPAPPRNTVAPSEPLASPTVNPATGATLVPLGRSVVDPATGRMYHEVPGGYLDPATGQFVPKR
jgi:hypothetical protein